LLLSVAMLGRWQAGLVAVATVSRHSPVATVVLSSNDLGYVTSAHWYFDRSGPIVSDLK
jgi:hypothetical protein